MLPTRVGMVRVEWHSTLFLGGAPHPRGDGPPIADIRSLFGACSPPAWGWSAAFSDYVDGFGVLPTRVGMVRVQASSRTVTGSAPHPRGDGPSNVKFWGARGECSPPAWGWSAFSDYVDGFGPVLPTRVGMVRCRDSVSRDGGLKGLDQGAK